MVQPGGDPSLTSAVPLSTSPVSLLPVFSTASAALPAVGSEAEGKPADEDAESELEPMRNGAGHISETESSDSGANPGDKESSTGASQDMEGLRLLRSFTKYISVLAKSSFVTHICFPISQILLGGADLVESNGKRQYSRDFLLGFQFMPACIQKPEGLPPITDVVLDKVGRLAFW